MSEYPQHFSFTLLVIYVTNLLNIAAPVFTRTKNLDMINGFKISNASDKKITTLLVNATFQLRNFI